MMEILRRFVRGMAAEAEAVAREMFSHYLIVMAVTEELFFRLMCTDIGDYLSRFAKGMAADAADYMFFLMMCTTNLGDSLNYINHQVTFNFTFNNTRRRRCSRIDSAAAADCGIVVEYGRWHELPVELMEMILHHSDVTDRFRMSMVCKSWESVLKRKDVRVPPQFPWLLLPHPLRHCKKLTFYDMSHGRIHDLKLPRWIHGGRCLGSSKGWLIMVKEPLLTKAQIFIFDPISGARHKLPSLRDKLTNHSLGDFLGRIELSSENPSNCIVATIIYSPTCHMLAFCRVGDQSWGIYEGSIEDKFVDILFSKYNETLYVLKLTDQESIAAYSFRSTDYQVSVKIIPLSHSDPMFHVEEYDDHYVEHVNGHFSNTRVFFTFHLVESSNGHLLLIQKIMDALETMAPNEEDADANEEVADANDDDAIEDYYEEADAIYDINEENEDDHNELDEQVEVDNNTRILKYCRTRKFNICMLDPENGTSRMTKLTSLGDQILLFSSGGLSFVQTGDFTGFQENCIYFIEGYINNQHFEHSPLVSRESGIFYLDGERIERSFPSVKLPVQSHMGWFTPNPLNQFNF